MLASTGKNKGSLFKQEYNTFYKEFKISSYKLLPKDKYEEALIWLRKRNAYKGKKVLRQGNKEEWRKEQYTAIYFKANNLGMSKEDLYLFATEKLALKKPLTSLKELSDTRLEKLYKYIIVKKQFFNSKCKKEFTISNGEKNGEVIGEKPNAKKTSPF